MMRDPILDWFKFHGEKTGRSRDDFDPKSFMEWIKKKGIEFEAEMIEYLRGQVAPDVIDEVSPDPSSRSHEQYERTLDLMSKGRPYIYQAVLRNDQLKYYGIADLLIRSDYVRKLFPHARVEKHGCRWSNRWCYLVVDLKFKMLPLSSDGQRVLNSGTIPANKGQLLMYNLMIDEMQGHRPNLAYLLGRGWNLRRKGERHTNKSAMDRLGYVDFSHPFDAKYYSMVEEAVAWIRRVREEGKIMNPWENDEHIPELFPNMKNQFDSPWHGAKADLADDIGEITSVYYCGVNKRQNAHSREVYSWQDPQCTSTTLKTAPSRCLVIDQMLRVNRGEIKEPFWPVHVENNIGGWKNSPARGKMEYFVDFESKNSTDDDFNELPYVGAGEYIFMIGVAWWSDNQNQWEYKCMMVNQTTHDEEEQIVREFIEFVGDNKCYHWSHAEPRMLTSAFSRHDIHPSNLPNFQDMLKIFRDEPVSIRGALNYSLKTITRAMYALNYIDETYDGECADGLGAVMIVVRAKGRNLRTNDEMKEVRDYNRKDCVILGKIMDHLREERIPPPPEPLLGPVTTTIGVDEPTGDDTIRLRSGRVIHSIEARTGKRTRVVPDSDDEDSADEEDNIGGLAEDAVETQPPVGWSPPMSPAELPPPMRSELDTISEISGDTIGDNSDWDREQALLDREFINDSDADPIDMALAPRIAEALNKMFNNEDFFSKSASPFEMSLDRYKEYLQDSELEDEEVQALYTATEDQFKQLKEHMKASVPSPYKVLEMNLTLDQKREIFQLYNVLIESGDYTRETYMIVDEIRRRVNYYETMGEVPDYPTLVERIKALPVDKKTRHRLIIRLNAVTVDGLNNDGNADGMLIQIAQEVEHQERVCAHPNYERPDDKMPPSLREQVMVSSLSSAQKKVLYSELDRQDPHGMHGGKAWVREVLRVPWGKYNRPPVSMKNTSVEISAYLAQVWQSLTETHVGAEHIKRSILDIVAKYVRNPEAKGIVIAFCGPPGTGKSELAGVIAKALNRGYHKIELGGIADASLIRGSESHWVGSKEGEPIRAMISTDCMNPVVAIDEVDKIDKPSVFGALIHYCDIDQSHHFRDDYLARLGSVDVSRHIRILIYNDESRVDSVLLDRAHKFLFNPYSVDEKVEIAQRALIPRILRDLTLTTDDISFSNEGVARFVNLSQSNEKGVRQLQRNLQTAFQKINTLLLTGQLTAPVIVGDNVNPEDMFWEPQDETTGYKTMYM